MPPRRAAPPPTGWATPAWAAAAAVAVVAATLIALLAASASHHRSAARSLRAWQAETAPALAASAAATALAAAFIGPRDWALAAAGGRVAAHSPLQPGTPAAEEEMMRAATRGSTTPGGLPPVHRRAAAWLLTPPPGGIPLPGACLPLAGQAGGWVEIVLGGPAPARPPRVTALTLDAPPSATSWADGLAALPSALAVSLSEDGSGWVDAGEVRPPPPGPGFTPPTALPLPSPGRARLVRVRVLANRGHAGGTCLHRVRVHGEE